jgi:hypothetical protein
MGSRDTEAESALVSVEVHCDEVSVLLTVEAFCYQAAAEAAWAAVQEVHARDSGLLVVRHAR